MKSVTKVLQYLVKLGAQELTPHIARKPTSRIRSLSPDSHKRKDLINLLLCNVCSPTFSQHPIIPTFADLGRPIHNTMGRYTICLTTEEHRMNTYAKFFDDLFFANKVRDFCSLRRKDTGVESGTFGEFLQWKEKPQVIIYTDLGKKTSLTNERDKKIFLERLLVGMCWAFLYIYECKEPCCAESQEGGAELEKLFDELSRALDKDLGIKLELEWKKEGFVRIGTSPFSPARYGATRFY
ncbi:uncharacterized protein Bfra_001724 [Botrytis fragariae]|uniref:Uncharacterized protein n=1 Tax=Botrytis fragariae TaxID=1964551 RepID=A0A8H6B1G5_9HELO|nr:uncharacterized protein Bfra_001724 [Botrytis fragariae]KAF5877357.1 hypothetical protein Bfra_001724 [Botrytis fragariae]